MPASDTLVGVLGWTATVCFAMILVPQIVLNQLRRSCEGFSISLLLLWHIGAAAVFPFFMFEEEPLPLMLQCGLFTIASVLCEVQFYAFRPGQEQPPATWKLWALGLTSFGLSAGFILGLMALFHFVDHSSLRWLIDCIGSVISSLCFALGFIPQLNLMFTTRSSEGFSVGVSLLDLTGSLLSIIVLVLEADNYRADPEAIMPYGIIVGMQSLLLFMALVVYPDPNRWRQSKTALAAALTALSVCPALAARLRGEEEKPLDKDLELGVNGLDYTRHTSLLSSHASSIYIDYDVDPDLLEQATDLGAAGGVSHIISPVPSCPCPSPAASTASLPSLDPHAVEPPVLMVEETPQQEEEEEEQQQQPPPPATPRAEHEAATEAKAAADDERFFSRHRSAPTVRIAAAGDDAAFAAAAAERAAAEREWEVEMDWRPTYGDFTDVDLGGCWDGPAPVRGAAGGVPPPSPQQPYMQVAAPVQQQQQQQQPKPAKEELRPAAPPAPAAFAEESAWQRRRRQQHRGRSRSFSSSRKGLGLPARPLEPSQ